MDVLLIKQKACGMGNYMQNIFLCTDVHVHGPNEEFFSLDLGLEWN